MDNIKESRVSLRTDPVKLASSLLISLNEGKVLKVIAIGNESIGIMGKALAFVNSFNMENKTPYLIRFIPGFEQVDTPQGSRNAVVFTVLIEE